MTDEIQPALTPEQWKTIPADWELERESSGPLTGITISYTDGDFFYGEVHSPLTPAQVIALVNHALPADHPLKLTAKHVHALRRIVEMDPQDEVWNEGDGYVEIYQSEDMRLYLSEIGVLADIIAALLPPSPKK